MIEPFKDGCLKLVELFGKLAKAIGVVYFLKFSREETGITLFLDPFLSKFYTPCMPYVPWGPVLGVKKALRSTFFLAFETIGLFIPKFGMGLTAIGVLVLEVKETTVLWLVSKLFVFD